MRSVVCAECGRVLDQDDHYSFFPQDQVARCCCSGCAVTAPSVDPPPDGVERRMYVRRSSDNQSVDVTHKFKWKSHDRRKGR